MDAPAETEDPAELREPPCPVETTLEVTGGRWKALILYHLRGGPERFNELRRLVPAVTQRMLTAHLRELERDGVVRRKVFAVVPPRVDYSLTPPGRALWPILSAMAEWGGRYRGRGTRPVREARRTRSASAAPPSPAPPAGPPPRPPR